MLTKKEVASLRNSNPISRERLEEMAYWIEQDISGFSIDDAFVFLLRECELMYSELIKVIAGKTSCVYPELNDYDQVKLQNCKRVMILLNIELEVSYPGDSPENLGNLQSDTGRVKKHIGVSDEEEIYRRPDHPNLG